MPYKKGFLKGIAFTNKINKRLRRMLETLAKEHKTNQDKRQTLTKSF
jgi:hypothetical protein